MITSYSTKDGQNMNPAVCNSMFVLRDKVFRQRLGWDVKTFDNREFDEYDDEDARYVISTDQYNKVNGCIRLRPTTKSYMLKDIFFALAQGEKLPRDTQIWEASRFALSSDLVNNTKLQCSLSLTSLLILKETIELATANNVVEIVTVASVAVERLYAKTGMDIRRLGNGKVCRIGKVSSVACSIGINDKTTNALELLIQEYKHGQQVA